MAIERVSERLLRAATALERANVPYAVIVMKLQAFRDIDRVHVRDMLAVGLIDDALARQLPSDLRGRLDELRSSPDG